MEGIAPGRAVDLALHFGDDGLGRAIVALLGGFEGLIHISELSWGRVSAPSDVARPLQIQRDDVLLHFTAQLYTADGRMVDYSISYFLPGYFRFHVVRKVGGAG